MSKVINSSKALTWTNMKELTNLFNGQTLNVIIPLQSIVMGIILFLSSTVYLDGVVKMNGDDGGARNYNSFCELNDIDINVAKYICTLVKHWMACSSIGIVVGILETVYGIAAMKFNWIDNKWKLWFCFEIFFTFAVLTIMSWSINTSPNAVVLDHFFNFGSHNVDTLANVFLAISAINFIFLLSSLIYVVWIRSKAH